MSTHITATRDRQTENTLETYETTSHVRALSIPLISPLIERLAQGILLKRQKRLQEEFVEQAFAQTEKTPPPRPTDPHSACPYTPNDLFYACGCHPFSTRFSDVDSVIHFDDVLKANTEECLTSSARFDIGKANVFSGEIRACLSSKQTLTTEQSTLIAALTETIINKGLVNKTEVDAWGACYANQVDTEKQIQQYFSDDYLLTPEDTNARDQFVNTLLEKENGLMSHNTALTTYLQGLYVQAQRGWNSVRASLLQNTNPGNALLRTYVEKLKPTEQEAAFLGNAKPAEQITAEQPVTLQAILPRVELAKTLLTNPHANNALVDVSAGNDFAITLTHDGHPSWLGHNHNGHDQEYEKFITIDAGAGFYCGLTAERSVACHGELSREMQQFPEGPFIDLSVGREHACAIDEDNHVLCWGNNSQGQTDVPQAEITTDQSVTHVPQEFITISAGEYHNCGLTTKGDVVCWGRNKEAQLHVPDRDFISLSAGGYHMCGITSDQNALCWGDHSMKQLNAPNTQFMQISSGRNHTCGVTLDKHIACWGSDLNSQAKPKSLPPENFLLVSSGDSHSCAITESGKSVCWGDESMNQSRNEEMK